MDRGWSSARIVGKRGARHHDVASFSRPARFQRPGPWDFTLRGGPGRGAAAAGSERICARSALASGA